MSDPIIVSGDDTSTEVITLSMRVANYAARAAADPTARHLLPVGATAYEPGVAHRPLSAERLVRLFSAVSDLPVSQCWLRWTPFIRLINGFFCGIHVVFVSSVSLPPTRSMKTMPEIISDSALPTVTFT